MQDIYRRIPLDQLRESPTNPRKRYHEPSLNELAQSIALHDVVQPILTRPHPVEAEAFEIVCGSRRFRGATLAAVADVPSLVRDLTDEQVITLQAIENIQREDVHPLEEACSYRDLLALGQEVATIAAQVGKSETYIYQRLKLLDLCETAQAAYLNDTFGTAHAIELARLPESAQRELLDDIIDRAKYDEPVTLADLRREIEAQYHLDLHRACFKKSDATLLPAAGACTTCEKRTGFVPALFPDIKKKDTCTDKVCFHNKVAAFIERTRATLAKDGATVPLVSQYYGSPKEGVIHHNQWVEATKACKHAVSGILADGHEAGRVLSVCSEALCNVHRAKGSAARAGASTTSGAKSKPTPQQLTAKRKESAKTAAMTRAVASVIAKTKTLGAADLKLVAKAVTTEMWNEHLKALCKRRGWEPKKTTYGTDYHAAAYNAIEKMDGADLAGLLMECALRGRFVQGTLHGKNDVFAVEVKRHGVDLAKLEKEALDELTAKEKARAQAPAKKPGTKGKRKAS